MDSTNADSVEIKYLKEKIDAGADFVITQLFYDVDGFLAWEKQCRSMGIVCPIIPGIMPIQSFNGFRRITNLAKIRVPATLTESLEPIKVQKNNGKSTRYVSWLAIVLKTLYLLFVERRSKSQRLWCSTGCRYYPTSAGCWDHWISHLYSKPRKICPPNSGARWIRDPRHCRSEAAAAPDH